MEPLLDSCLQLNTTSHLFHLEPPKYTSAAGRRIDKNDAPTPPAPMVYTPDSRLVLYERVITTKQEAQLLDKLSKPKWMVQPINKEEGHGHGCGGAASTSAGITPALTGQGCNARSQSSSGPASTAASRAPGNAPTSNRDSKATGSHTHQAASASGREHPHAARSMSSGKGRAGPNGKGGGSSTSDHPQAVGLQRYFDQERAAVTVSSVFTWGNRYKPGGEPGRSSRETRGVVLSGTTASGAASNKGTFTSWSPSQHKPPLRL